MFNTFFGRTKPVLKKAPRRTRMESVEARQMLAADVLLGSVYLEDATEGGDNSPDTIQVSFVGGAEGTTLDRLVIDGDKLVINESGELVADPGNGLIFGASNGDVFFDTLENGEPGSFGATGFSVVSTDGFEMLSVEVIDGGTRIAFEFEGFEAGEEFVFSVDVDEYGAVGGALTSNAFAEGAEFAGSTMTGDFTAPGFKDLTLQNYYYDAFDSDFAAAESAADADLTQLPSDDYDSPSEPRIPVRTAGAVAYAPQVEYASLSGFVYHDRDDDASKDAGEEGIGGVTVELFDAAGNRTTTTTNGDGYYEFLDLEADTYRVQEFQPTGWLDGQDAAGSAGGDVSNDLLSNIVLAFGQRSINNNFGELLPGSISGRVHASDGPDCDFENPDVLLEGVRINLYNGGATPFRTTTTDSQGRYTFTDLPPGEYTVEEIQPVGYYQGGERVGTAEGTATENRISQIGLSSDEDAVNYDFCEHLGANLSGYVYHDRSNEGSRDAPEEEGISGVTLKLLNGDGSDTGRIAITDANGFYEFTNLDRGKYRVMEIHPTEWRDGIDREGNFGGTPDNPGDMISEIMLDYGDDATEYNFGELLTASIAGRVHASNGPDCDFVNPDILLSGVKIDLLDPSGNVVQTTTTNELGEYRFDDLDPGIYSVREQQPEGYYQGGERIGTAAGISEDNVISFIALSSGVAATQYDFCEHVGADLSGYVYHDEDNDGVRDPGEDPIPGTIVKLLDAAGNPTGQTATTNELGYYEFTNLDRGKYGVMEIQPESWLDGRDTAGTKGGDVSDDMITTIMLDYGDDAREYNFGELLPASIAGSVHSSPDGNCLDDDLAEPIAGVTIELISESGEITRTTTDANGRYQFDNLAPGTYSVRETQPVEFFDGVDHVGSEGGNVSNDLFTAVVLGSGIVATDYDFCETPTAELSGYVFIDGAPLFSVNGELPGSIYEVSDGLRTGDDTPLAGIVVRLVNGTSGSPFYLLQPGEELAPEGFAGIETLPGAYPDGVYETVTDANGYYEFLGLPAGSYGVVEVQPIGLIDGIDTAGSTGGVPRNPPSPGVPTDLIPYGSEYGNNFISRIALAAGQSSVENNFSELDTYTGWIPPETPEVPPPFTPPIVITPGPANPLGIFTPPTRPGEEIFGGSSQAVGYTWHLSVVNAGNPRELAEGQSPLRLASQSNDPSWDGADRQTSELRKAQWRLLADEPNGAALDDLLFGSEDAIPVSGDWDGDGIADIGVFLDGDWYLDLDGNGRWSAGDLWAQLGSRDDLPVTGDWDGDGKTDIGIYGPAWPRDPHAIEREAGMPDVANWPGPIEGKAKNVPPTEEDATSGARLLKMRAIAARRTDVIDHVFHYGSPGDAPVVGDWNGDGIRTIGVFRDGSWNLDTNGDGKLGPDDRAVTLGQAGDTPIVGDYDGNGVDDLGVYRGGQWLVDPDGDGTLEELRLNAKDRALASETPGLPVVGDWDGDGADEPAVYTPAARAEAESPDVRVSQRNAG